MVSDGGASPFQGFYLAPSCSSSSSRNRLLRLLLEQRLAPARNWPARVDVRFLRLLLMLLLELELVLKVEEKFERIFDQSQSG